MQQQRTPPQIDIYAELCPASSLAIISCGMITAAMGDLPLGLIVMLGGISVGVIAPLVKTFNNRNQQTI